MAAYACANRHPSLLVHQIELSVSVCHFSDNAIWIAFSVFLINGSTSEHGDRALKHMLSR